MKISDIMTPHPVSISDLASVDVAMRTMDTHRIRHLPVVDRSKLVGVVSDHDLLQATGWLPARVRDVFDPESRRKLVRDVMQRPPITTSSKVGVLSACLDLLGRRIGCLPVVDDGELVGVLSEMDVLGLYVRTIGGEPEDQPVGVRMTPNPVTLGEAATLAHAAELMLSIGARHLPVVAAGRLVGLLSDRDLYRATGSNRDPEGRVDEVMTRDVVAIVPDDPLSRAAELMVRHRVSAIPVVENELLEGLITLSDLLDHCLVTLRDPAPIRRGS